MERERRKKSVIATISVAVEKKRRRRGERGNESLLNLTPDCLLTESRSLADESEQRITTGVSSWPEREIYSQR